MLAFFSTVCIVTGTLLGLPQAIRIVREKSSAGLSLLAWQVWMAVTTVWTVHGVLLGSITQIIPNAIGIAECLAILLLTRRDRGLTLGRTFWLAILLTVVATSIRVGLGPVAFASFMLFPQAAAVLGQFVDIVRCRDIRGVSPLYLVLTVVLQVSWIGYGRLLPDIAAVVCSSMMLALGLLNLGWWSARRLGLRALWPTVDPDVTDVVDVTDATAAV